ncbi:MAG: carboxypeptidase regulatory-like domain-containing protein [Planctomycetes bacterium]|nr:carboxypeptidase regulatory-like domain-containing protein [Planctomycetota bacterium]
MKTFRMMKGICVAVACFSLVVPVDVLMGADGSVSGQRPVARAAVRDVALSPQGEMVGRLLNEQGLPLAGISVTLRQGTQSVATAATDKQGYFVFKALRGGVYQLVAGQNTTLCRLWTANTAPPNAQRLVTLKTQKPVVRGQNPFDFTGVGGLTLEQFVIWGLSLGAAGVIGGVIGFNHALDRDTRPKSP